MHSRIPFYNTSSSRLEISGAIEEGKTTAIILPEALKHSDKEMINKMLTAIDISMESEVIIIIPAENETISVADLSDVGIELILVFGLTMKDKVQVGLAKETGFHYKIGSISIIFASSLKELSVSNIDKKILWNALKNYKRSREI